MRTARRIFGVAALAASLALTACQGNSPEGLGDPPASLPDGSDPGSTPIAELISPSLFEQIFLHRGTSPCRGVFYTYAAFLDAARSYPDFGGQGSLDDRKREVAAFLANVSHETTGGWATAPDGPYSWGLCWITEGATLDPMQLADYCAASTDYPCKAGKKYFGRGPIQLSWNYNTRLSPKTSTIPPVFPSVG